MKMNTLDIAKRPRCYLLDLSSLDQSFLSQSQLGRIHGIWVASRVWDGFHISWRVGVASVAFPMLSRIESRSVVLCASVFKFLNASPACSDPRSIIYGSVEFLFRGLHPSSPISL